MSGKILFSKVIDIDFYDGPTEAICEMEEAAQYYICSLVYINFSNGERIFTMLEIRKDAWIKVKSIFGEEGVNKAYIYDQLKREVKRIYSEYDGKVFLIKSKWLTEIEYEVIELPLNELRYFDNMEAVMVQGKESEDKWLNYCEG